MKKFNFSTISFKNSFPRLDWLEQKIRIGTHGYHKHQYFLFWPYSIPYYITLRHFICQLHLQWPMVHQQSHSSSPNASLERRVFKSFLKVGYQCLWVLGDWTEENSMPTVRRTRNSARRTLVSTVEVHIESCWLWLFRMNSHEIIYKIE